MEPRAIDRLSQTLLHVQPPLEEVSTPQHLRTWADAVIDKAADELDTRPVTGRITRILDGTQRADAVRLCGDGAIGLRDWERAFAQTLARLQTSGRLSCAADTATLGSAFAALLYGGLLLGQASGDSSPLRAAMDMALSQLDGHTRG